MNTPEIDQINDTEREIDMRRRITAWQNQTINDLARELTAVTEQRDEARETIAATLRAWQTAQEKIITVTKERDEARDEMIRWMSIAEGRGRTDDDDTGKAMAKLIRQRDEARGQRDRLAKALEHTIKHMRHSLNCPARLTEGLHACNCQMEWAYDNATEALQSLTPKTL